MSEMPTFSGMDAEVFEAFIDQLKRYIRDRLLPAEPEVIRRNCVPEEILAEMREMGLFGLTIPEEFGGAGMNVSQYIETIRQLSYVIPAFRSIISINIGMTCSAILKEGTAEQKERWLPLLASGTIACFGLTEPDSGSDSAAMKTKAVRKGTGYIINGTKRYITNAPFAKVALIMARTSLEALPRNASRCLRTGPKSQYSLSCLVPAFDGAVLSLGWKEALWDKFFTAAPRRQRQSVEQYKIVKRA
jgi:acyl-CoA dehydrogenase